MSLNQGRDDETSVQSPTVQEAEERGKRIRIKNRRKMYLDRNPSYFGASLELADPLLYDRCIRRFQSAAEREAEGRRKGYSGVLEADLMRSEAKVAALTAPTASSWTYTRGPNGEIYPEDPAEAPQDKADGEAWWRREMTQRFLNGRDDDFDYRVVDESDEWDDRAQEEREEEERFFDQEEPRWVSDEADAAGQDVMAAAVIYGETGIQDF
ncbi:MAG: hypothetical protein M1838_005307 [Thelocarpon superellum]|nr:MAG: hypothetical protein M1838_005307 [Thelocarpon superellum]